ncbi:hypothetical protein GGH91_000802 [Coemansia sp. RSA 2671]|nr:hypothetical protein GGH91_000802 [Coemansia sp. RSA 2671]
MSSTPLASPTATKPSSTVLDGTPWGTDQHDSGQFPITTTVCDFTTCFMATIGLSKSPRNSFPSSPTPSTSSTTSTSSPPMASLPSPNPLYTPSDLSYSSPDVISDGSEEDDVSPAAIPSAVAVVAFIVVVVLLIICIRRRRRKKREQKIALRLKSEADSRISLPATPLSLSGGSDTHFGQRYYSQSSLTPSRLQSPLTPYSQVSVAPVELSQIHSTQTTHSLAGSGDGQLTVPVAAVSRPRPPPPPPPLRSQTPLPPPPHQSQAPLSLPPHMTLRERADTFSDIPHDDLPPYVDPIEEAMTASTESEASAAPAPSRQPQPPPYHVVRIPAPAGARHQGL